MGMDLQPIDPSPNAPLDDNGEAMWGRYNWRGWTWLVEWLDSRGVNTFEFAGSNDGEEISAETCKTVADTLRANLDELGSDDREWLEPHILLWATCGGYRQY